MQEGRVGYLLVVTLAGTFTASRPSARAAARGASSGSTRGSPTTGRGCSPSSPPSTPEPLLPLPRAREDEEFEVYLTGPMHDLVIVVARWRVGERNSASVTALDLF